MLRKRKRLTKIFPFYLTILMSLIFFSDIILSQPRVNKTKSVTVADSTLRLKNLSIEIQSLLSRKELQKTKFGISIYSLDRHKSLLKKNADAMLVPASNTKLVTSFVALAQLGKDFQIKTSVYTDSDNLKNGVLTGDIYLVGRGDALLSVSDIEFLADQISNLGIKQINGNICADGSFFDNMVKRITYSGDRDEVESIPAVTALSINNNTATVLISSGPVAGKPVKVQIIPASPSFKISSSATVGSLVQQKATKQPTKHRHRASLSDFINTTLTECFDINTYSNSINQYGGVKSKNRLRVKSKQPQKKAIVPSKPVPSRRGISVSTKIDADGRQVFIINGSLPPNRTVSYRHQIFKPDVVVAGVLFDRLQAGGIKINGSIIKQNLTEQNKKTKLLAELQRPLTIILSIQNKNSDNYLAENVFKLIGANGGNRDNNAQESKKIINQIFNKYKIPNSGCIINDGSGLSRRNCISAESMSTMMQATASLPFYNALDSTLSIAAVDGTLRRRMSGTAAARNVHAKTGTHNNVSALSGYVRTSDGERYVFSYIFNGPYVNFYKKIENEICVVLANFSYSK